MAPVAVRLNDSTVRKQAWYRFGSTDSTVCSTAAIGFRFNDLKAGVGTVAAKEGLYV